MSVLVLGAGLSGLTLAALLNRDTVVVEKEKTCGGLCRSVLKKGFVFDQAGHVLHFKDKKNLAWVRRLLKDNLASHTRDSRVWIENTLISYPFQYHFCRLSSETYHECLAGFFCAQSQPKKDRDFESWIKTTFGPGIARHFMIPYNEKFWRYPLKSLTADWAERFIPVPRVPELKNRRSGGRLGYNANFWYPRKGGIQALIQALEKRVSDVKTSCCLARLDLNKKIAYFTNGWKTGFSCAVSTIPLHALRHVVRPLPANVEKAFSQLKYISVLNVNFGISASLARCGHWIYFPQRDIAFYRLGFPANFEPAVAPPQAASLSFEVSYAPEEGVDKKKMPERLLADCRKFGLTIQSRDIRIRDIQDIKYAYCVYDRHRNKAVSIIQDYLARFDVFLAGRYGAWQYASMEDVMDQARQMAEKLNRKPC